MAKNPTQQRIADEKRNQNIGLFIQAILVVAFMFWVIPSVVKFILQLIY